MKKKRKWAFTLAEVLITLGIIGVVAALTIPNLITSYREKAAISKLENIYSILTEAMRFAVDEYGTADSWEPYTYNYKIKDNVTGQETEKTHSSSNPAHLVEFLKVAKDCRYTSSGCFVPDGYKQLAGWKERDFENINANSHPLQSYYKFIMLDGTTVAMEGYHFGKTDTNRKVGEIWVDINGHSKPNTAGKDLFLFYYTKDAIYPFGENYINTNTPLSKTNCKKTDCGYDCTAWVLKNKNLDYLHCDDLSWGGKTECKK